MYNWCTQISQCQRLFKSCSIFFNNQSMPFPWVTVFLNGLTENILTHCLQCEQNRQENVFSLFKVNSRGKDILDFIWCWKMSEDICFVLRSKVRTEQTEIHSHFIKRQDTSMFTFSRVVAELKHDLVLVGSFDLLPYNLLDKLFFCTDLFHF